MLSKSDFKTALNCPTKLYYRKKRYKTTASGNEYMQVLAEGGYRVGRMAQCYWEHGIKIDTRQGLVQAAQLTDQYLQESEVCLFEAVFIANNMVVVADIVEKKGNTLFLYEVKSGNAEEKGFETKWTEELDEIAYQVLVIQEAYPEFKVHAHLMAPAKEQRTHIGSLSQYFKLERVEDIQGFQHMEVSFTGNASTIKADGLLEIIPVDEYLPNRILKHKPLIKQFLKAIEEDMKIVVPLSKNCFKCEFNVANGPSGYNECWQNMPKPNNPISELYFIGSIKEDKQIYVDNLIAQRKLDFKDLDPEIAFNKAQGARRRIQVDYTISNSEWQSEELQVNMQAWQYPLHFIDFETCSPVIPFYKGMYPYEQIAFQWSCHTIPYHGAEPIHSEWINVEDSFPNFRFAEKLMQQIGHDGTPLMWATHENTILRTIWKQMQERGYENLQLEQWLYNIISLKDDKGKPLKDGQLVDMNDLMLKHYFHPLMKGKTSIKYTLPAILQARANDRIKGWLRNFEPGLSLWNEGDFVNPYQLLPTFEGIGEKEETLNLGTGAMMAYEQMMYGTYLEGSTTKQNYRQALLRYCKLDTLAMVMIWEGLRDK